MTEPIDIMAIASHLRSEAVAALHVSEIMQASPAAAALRDRAIFAIRVADRDLDAARELAAEVAAANA